MEECGLQFFTFEQAHSRPYRSEFRYRPFWPAVLLALTTAAAIVTLFGGRKDGDHELGWTHPPRLDFSLVLDIRAHLPLHAFALECDLAPGWCAL
jgi:hypothetical protein